mmetsp:Transcript_10071/g.31558  ORF Transcript_10071/g.31558 Transcript_10071/m.31558 type:complete len:269 (-) Transcript_10071:210-1016(-)
MRSRRPRTQFTSRFSQRTVVSLRVLPPRSCPSRRKCSSASILLRRGYSTKARSSSASEPPAAGSANTGAKDRTKETTSASSGQRRATEVRSSADSSGGGSWNCAAASPSESDSLSAGRLPLPPLPFFLRRSPGSQKASSSLSSSMSSSSSSSSSHCSHSDSSLSDSLPDGEPLLKLPADPLPRLFFFLPTAAPSALRLRGLPTLGCSLEKGPSISGLPKTPPAFLPQHFLKASSASSAASFSSASRGRLFLGARHTSATASRNAAQSS